MRPTIKKHERPEEENVQLNQTSHVSAEEVVHLVLHSALALGVEGEQVAGEAQRAAAGFIAGQEEDERLTYDLILRHRLPLRSPGGRLVAVEMLVLLPRRLVAAAGVQHELQEVSPPLRERTCDCVVDGGASQVKR